MNGRATGSEGPIHVFSLAPSCRPDDLEAETPYLATVNGVVPYGVFVDVTEHVSGLIHESNLQEELDVGDEVVVELIAIHENGDIAFEHLDVDEYEIIETGWFADPRPIGELEATEDPATVEGRVDQIKQTGGPTVLTLNDGTGLFNCAAFEAAGVRAYPALELGDIVRVRGPIQHRNGGLQLEVDRLRPVDEEDATAIRARLEERLDERATVPDIDPLIDWPALEPLWPELEAVATTLRRMLLENRPIRIRHHADGDGMCAAVPLELALERFVEQHHADPEAPRHLVQRSPSKAPYYELEDAVRDLNYALQDRARHGQRLPMLLMLDNGSTEEDVPAYRNLAHYDIPIAVVDHHHPDGAVVDDLLTAHVNPYRHGEDYRLTTGMLSVEIARMIDPTITEAITHVPAVAGLADRSEADEMAAYFSLAAESGFAVEDLREIGDALDYAAHWLRYRAGTRIIRDVLAVDGNGAPTDAVVDLLADRSRTAMNRQREDARPHVSRTPLDNGAVLFQLDLDAHAHRFEYPPPGKTTGALHDALATDEAGPVITMGYGPDFAVLRSDGVRLDIPEMVGELDDELPGAGVSGGGHLVVGSLSFVRGRREAVLEALVEKMAAAAIDEELTSTAEVAEPDA